MQQFKRILALALVLIMTIGFLPVGAAATETDAPEAGIAETAPVDVSTAETEPVVEEITETETLDEEIPDAEPAAVATANRPADGTTQNQPFPSNTANCQYFRIPALTVLADGTLVAAADARWNDLNDRGDIDTIVSVSEDQGKTWNYTFANYIDDGSNSYSVKDATFIDPALAVKDVDGVETIFMLVDLFPGQASGSTNSIAKANAGTGMTADGHLMVYTTSNYGTGTYTYYVGNYTNGVAPLLKKSDNSTTGYTVDEEFYVYNSSGTRLGNLFNYGQVKIGSTSVSAYMTSYLYLTKSTDGGKTWSAPTLINNQVKDSSEKFYGVGPASGYVTSSGLILFSCYTYDTQDGNTSVIYSDDNGVTWHRTDSVKEQTSEAALTEIDGVVYMFTRHGGYYYYDLATSTSWSSKQEVSGISYTTSCEMSVMTYSEKIDGKNAIILSAPTNDRKAGKLFVGLVNDDHSITWKYTYAVNGSSTYQYSSVKELNDGSIGLLYEDGSASITYTNIAIEDIVPGAVIGDPEPAFLDGGEIVTKLTLTDGGASKTLAFQGLAAGETISLSSSNSKVATAVLNGDNSITIKPVGAGTATITATITTAARAIGDSITLDVTVNAAEETPVTNYVDITLFEGGSTTITDTTGNYANSNYTAPNSNIATMTVTGQDAIPGTVSYNATSVRYDNLTTAGSWARTDYYHLVNGNYYPVYAYRDWGIISYTYYYGYSMTDSSSDVIEAGSGRGSSSVTLYTKSSTAGVAAFTTITFTGVAAGVTYATVGSTRYTITVLDVPECVTPENSPFVSNTGNYKNKVVTKLTISEGKSYDLNLKISGSNVTWSSSDASVVTVDQNGTVTAGTVGTAFVSCTVNGVMYAIPVVVLDTVDESKNATASGTCDFYIDEITNTHVAYSIDMSTDLLEAQEGEAIYLGYTYGSSKSFGFGINFFGAEDDGYALTFMAATGSNNGNYFALYGSPDNASNLSAYKSGAALFNANQYWKNNEPLNLLKYVITNGYDGTMGWTRGSGHTGSSITSSLTFRSQKLPTVTKEIVSVHGQPYTEGMHAQVGDVINFRITVTQYATTEKITYSNDKLTETLVPISGNNYSVSGFLSDNTLNADKTYIYNVSYTIKESDLDTMITNTVNLTYSYKATYSDGTFSANADASAAITASVFEPKDIVADFGQSVTVHYDVWGAPAALDTTRGSARYGDVTVTGNTTKGWDVTYTPNTILKGVDTVRLYGTKGAEYSFDVYPATTVYYEEGFLMAGSSGWSTGSKATANQTAEVLGQKDHAYGYDPIYGNNQVSKNTASATAMGASASFSFTGNGFVLYADCTDSTGYISVDVRDAADRSVKMVIVNTAVKGGSGAGTSGQSGAMASLPIVSMKDMAYGTYTVNLTKVMNDGKAVNIDGVRIINTLADSSVFVEDLEDNPEFYELRDMVLHAVGVGSDNAEDYEDLQGKSQQIFNDLFGSDSESPVAVITDPGHIYGSADAQDLLDNGPKNELYLWKGQTLTFRVNTNRCMQVGLKAPSGSTGYTLKVNNQTVSSNTLASSVDLFYDLVKAPASTVTEYTVSITNTGDNVLSVTDLKICDDPSAAFVPLTEEDICDILAGAGYTDPSAEHVCPSASFTDVTAEHWFHDAVDFVVEDGLMNGMSTTIFNPNGNMNRAQIVTVLYRLAGSPAVETPSSFTDVPVDSFYGNAVAWAVSNGITNGVSATTFNPDGDITREQMVTFLYRYVKSTGEDMTTTSDLSGYTDASAVSSWALDAFVWAVENGIISGMTADTLVPGATTNRAQVATVLMRFLSN